MFKSCASRDCYISRKAFASIFKSIEISKTKKKRNKIFVIFFSGAASLRDGERYIFEAILDSVGSPCASVAIQGAFIKSACIIYTNPFSQAEKRASPRETPPGHDGQQPQLCRREGETDGCLSTPLQKNRWKRRTGMTEPVDALDFNTEQRPTKRNYDPCSCLIIPITMPRLPRNRFERDRTPLICFVKLLCQFLTLVE